jgi:hypothetical protein
MPSYNAFLAAVKEALWHADLAGVWAAVSTVRAESGYWYHLAIPGLVLDRSPHSVTLEAPLQEILECLR